MSKSKEKLHEKHDVGNLVLGNIANHNVFRASLITGITKRRIFFFFNDIPHL